mmetsp:Transcript_6968/g.26049  ORF Transcript_6968/g.26049 Transcript_6968/m.26049 type:complete len:198 (-) Transcript_6968:4484-5077(-)
MTGKKRKRLHFEPQPNPPSSHPLHLLQSALNRPVRILAKQHAFSCGRMYTQHVHQNELNSQQNAIDDSWEQTIDTIQHNAPTNNTSLITTAAQQETTLFSSTSSSTEIPPEMLPTKVAESERIPLMFLHAEALISYDKHHNLLLENVHEIKWVYEKSYVKNTLNRKRKRTQWIRKEERRHVDVLLLRGESIVSVTSM